MAQSVFTGLAQDATLYAQRPLTERVAIEGWAYNGGAESEGSTFTTDGSVSAGAPWPGLTRAWYIDQIVVSANKNARLQVSWSESGYDGNRSNLLNLFCTPNQSQIIPVGRVVRPASLAPQSGVVNPSAKIRNVFDTDKTGVNFVFYINGWSITDDLDFFAPKTILWLGDSITAGGTGPTVKTNQYDWRVRAYYRGKGIRSRLVQMSLSGSTAAQHDSRISQGRYDGIPADLICYSLGANDAGLGGTASAYRTNVDNAIAWKKSQYPNAKMVVFGPTPNQTNATETLLVAYRTQAAAAVTAAADTKVKFCDLGSSLDRTVQGNYASTDTPGAGVHLSDTGHAAVWAVIQPFLDGNLATI